MIMIFNKTTHICISKFAILYSFSVSIETIRDATNSHLRVTLCGSKATSILNQSCCMLTHIKSIGLSFSISHACLGKFNMYCGILRTIKCAIYLNEYQSMQGGLY